MLRYKPSLDILLSLRDTLNSLNQRHFCLLAKTNNEYDVQMTQDYICMYISDVYPFKCIILMVRNMLFFRDHNNINTHLTRNM